MPLGIRPEQRRSMTFTGCWTCKARKVRCDEQPLECGNCEKRGITCGGYGIKLQWMSDPFAQSVSNSQGRRRITLDEHAGLKYRIEDIDDFLFSLDNDSRTGISSRKGPFSTFPTCDQTEERRDQQKSTTLQQQGDFSTPRRPDSNQDFLHEGGVDDTNHADTNAFDADEVDANESSSFPLFADLYNKSGDFLGDWLRPHDIMWSSPPDREESDDHNRNVSNYFGDEYLECLALTVETDTVNGRELHMEAIKDLACAPPLNCIGGSPFEDVAVSYLLHHYTIHVADILQPILHPQNPYRGLYIPAALEGALISQMGPQGDKDNVHVALYHAILASSAFHLWNCDRSQLKYREIGVRHRHHAFHQLQIAANSSTASSNYRAFLMVILCLLTIGVISGDDDFAVHLNGARQLRSIRKRWKIVSGQTRQLNEISTFLTLLARTTAIKTPSVELQYGENGASSGDDLVEQSNTCYEYMYGVTPMIATAIQETCRLAEILAQYGDVHDIPDPLLQACEELGERLQSWHLASERPAPIPAGDDEMLAIFTHHANAWHCAALLYYYRRIQNCHAADLVREVDLIADHMHAVEDTKVRSKSECIRRTAPITWPMFVASCDAVGASRDRCRKWWERVERYGISNISRQWEVVQQIWEKMEEIRLNGNDTTSWMDAFVSLDIKLLPV